MFFFYHLDAVFPYIRIPLSENFEISDIETRRLFRLDREDASQTAGFKIRFLYMIRYRSGIVWFGYLLLFNTIKKSISLLDHLRNHGDITVGQIMWACWP